MKSLDKFYLAPLQSFTDFAYRKSYHRLFGGFEAYYIPYIAAGSGDKIRNSQLRDLQPEHNEGIPVVPQILCANPDELISLAKRVEDFGYKKVNLNMGCPYPMATNRGRGAALLEKPDQLKAILDTLFEQYQFDVSVKFRAGMSDDHAVFKLIDLLKSYPITQYTFHPRTAVQLYKGEADRQLFAEFSREFGQPLVYNGDIQTAADLEEIRELVPSQTDWMIGRGVLTNPFLLTELRGEELTPERKNELKQQFHQAFFDEYRAIFSDDGQVLMKMKGFWTYFAESFSNPHKAFKLVKKASSMPKYDAAIATIFREFSL